MGRGLALVAADGNGGTLRHSKTDEHNDEKNGRSANGGRSEELGEYVI